MTGTFSCEGALSYVGGRAVVVRARKSHNDVLIWGAGVGQVTTQGPTHGVQSSNKYWIGITLYEVKSPLPKCRLIP